MNPARALAPALVSGTWNGDQIIYWVGPILGAIAGALLYTALFLRKEDLPPSATTTAEDPARSEPGLFREG